LKKGFHSSYKFWSFPCGKMVHAESPVLAARRELLEETGIEAVGDPLLEKTVFAGSETVAYKIHSFCFLSLREAPLTPSSELKARWVPLAEAIQLRPMAAGTRNVLYRVQRAVDRGAD
jgi:8-oxo-dGTP pyrophosphatase MutT (NUDIX family)